MNYFVTQIILKDLWKLIQLIFGSWIQFLEHSESSWCSYWLFWPYQAYDKYIRLSYSEWLLFGCLQTTRKKLHHFCIIGFPITYIVHLYFDVQFLITYTTNLFDLGLIYRERLINVSCRYCDLTFIYFRDRRGYVSPCTEIFQQVSLTYAAKLS